MAQYYFSTKNIYFLKQRKHIKNITLFYFIEYTAGKL